MFGRYVKGGRSTMDHFATWCSPQSSLRGDNASYERQQLASSSSTVPEVADWSRLHWATADQSWVAIQPSIELLEHGRLEGVDIAPRNAVSCDRRSEKRTAPPLEEIRLRLATYRRVVEDSRVDYPIGCILLEQPFFLPERDWIPVPGDWKPNIVQGKGYEEKRWESLRRQTLSSCRSLRSASARRESRIHGSGRARSEFSSRICTTGVAQSPERRRFPFCRRRTSSRTRRKVRTTRATGCCSAATCTHCSTSDT